ncbi:MAG: crossover junction endodeoxyribonuclease RuvC, partial [Acidimicrobiales bacterium]
MFVLGIDPGLSRCGYGAVGGHRAAPRAGPFGVVTTPPADPLAERLAELAGRLRALLDEVRPDVVVVERVFFQTNARTAMSVGQASGLALAAAAEAGCRVVQYTANEVKQAVVGYGAATKEQVQVMVQTLLRLP